MDNYKYKYTNPVDSGFIQFALTKKQHNKLFPQRKIDWRVRYEYYYDEHRVVMHRFYNWKGIFLVTLLFPLSVLYNGIGNIGESVDVLKRLYNQKERGAFTGDTISAKSDLYEEIMDTLNA